MGDILLRPLAVGICGTDLDIWRGLREDSAKILGHEVVAEVASDDPRFPLGTRVCVRPLTAHDQDDIIGHSAPGFFQPEVLFPDIKVERGSLSVFPSTGDFRLGALVEPLSAVMFQDELVPPGARTLIIGGGPAGVLLALVHQLTGRQCLLAHHGAVRRDWLVAEGLVSANQIQAVPSGEFDRAFVVVNRENGISATQQAFQHLTPNGVVCLISGLDTSTSIAEFGQPIADIRRQNVCGDGSPKLAPMVVNGKPYRVTGGRGCHARHMEAATQLLATHRDLFLKLVTHTVKLSELHETLNFLASHHSDERMIEGRHALKVAVVP